ncbi:MAG TPA: DUF1844 domain-containing protein [Chthoniobacterales bacterium]|jgi:hypothetical protein|nr:DUF1844 domain-containing protein [Chthoniobacterales bacterium]
MAEYQNTTVSSGEMTQRFIEFVMMQAQNAAFMLGQIPHPQSGKAEVNLDMAQLLIDQLVMIQDKTQGNLNSDESRILAGTISNLQMAFVEAVQSKSPVPSSDASGASSATHEPETSPKVDQKPADQPLPTQGGDAEGKKKFVKSYGS